MSETKDNLAADKQVSGKSLKERAEIVLNANLHNIAKKVKDGRTLSSTEVRLLEQARTAGEQVEAQPNETPDSFDSMKAAANGLDIPIERLKLAKKSGCPAFRGGRVYTQPLAKWFVDKSNTIDDDGTDWSQERIKIAAKRDKLRLLKDEQKAIDFDEVKFALARGMAALFSAIDRCFALELPPSLKGLNEMEIQAKCFVAAESFKETIRTELTKLGDEPQEGTE